MAASVFDHILKMICYMPCSIVLSYLMVRTLQVKHKYVYMVAFNAVQVLFYALYAFCFIDFSWGRTLNTVAQTAIYILGAVFFGQEQLLKRCLGGALVFSVSMLTEIFSVLFFVLSGGAIDIHQVAYASRNIPLYICYQSLNLALTLLLSFVVLQLWDKLVLRTGQQVLWYYALFPVSQALLYGACLVYISATGLSAGKYALLTVIVLFCILVDVILFRSMSQLTQKAIAEERAAWSESLLLQQESYYAQILSDTEDAARIRHDIRSQLQTAYSLMAQGDNDAAREQLDGIVSQLDRVPVYCAHKVVNALLAVKAERFRGAGIPFQFHCTVPHDLPFAGVDLCSLFSNVLDNAYKASFGLSGTVSLTAHVSHGYFCLTCSNPAQAAAKNTRRKGHGLGLAILSDLAERYHGEVVIKQPEGQFTISVFLKCE